MALHRVVAATNNNINQIWNLFNVKIHLSQSMFPHVLQCPTGMTRVELVDSYGCPGHYIEVRESNPGVGTYYYRYKDSNGKTCHKRIGSTIDMTLKNAREVAQGIRGAVTSGIDPKANEKPKIGTMTVSDLFELHVLPRSKVFKRSYARDLEMYNLRIKKAFGSKRLCDVSRGEVELFHSNLLSTLAPATCDHYVKLLRSAYFYALRHDFIERNVLSGIKLFNADNRVENVPTQEELESLLKVLQTDENRPVCLIALFLLSTGARLSEALKAQWKMIDRVNRVWRIPASNSKSKRIRSVPLSDAALDVLNQLATEGMYEDVFVTAKGLPYTTVHKVWGRIRRKAGVPKLRLHDLRHCNASWMVSQGISLFIVQEILGHSDPKITMRYSHVANKTMLEASNKASDFIRAAMPLNAGNLKVISPEAVNADTAAANSMAGGVALAA
jgi:integrase